jgi:glycosyltransferase involved in cell wall biosynthesis
MDKIKVVWICHFSNEQIRERLNFDRISPFALYRRFRGQYVFSDYAIWNTNAIKEFEKFDDIELHIVAPHYSISGIQEFDINGIQYHFFEREDDGLLSLLMNKIRKKIKTSYKKNSKVINKLVNKIKPDIVHLIGAENPYYGEAVLTLPRNIPLILTLQTLMNDPNFYANYPISKELYDYRASIEAQIIKRADYIGSNIEFFRRIIKESIYPSARFLNMTLAVGEDLSLINVDKQYDFVYFAADISKAADYAIEAFAITKKSYPNITLHIVGGYSESYRQTIENRIAELRLGDHVDFTGKLPTHDDVISEIRKAKFAVLPLKVDLIASTLREAMANGLPVVTTVTPATPTLNEKRESVLLSDIGDFAKMAENMCRLMADENLSQELRNNAARTVEELYSNAANMREWKSNYYAILKNER